MYPDQAISPDVLLLDATDSEKKAAHSGTMTPSPWRDTKYAAGKTTFQFHDRREESSVAQMSMDKQMVTFLGTVAKYLTRSNFKEERSILMYRLRGCGPSCWGRHDRRNSSPAGLHCRYAWPGDPSFRFPVPATIYLDQHHGFWPLWTCLWFPPLKTLLRLTGFIKFSSCVGKRFDRWLANSP
ncbi:uncharacterized protein LOC143443762 isoform X2 [Arvicanthis niloticus]|uniref:uncharacterized protein LOC143314038 isoform X2 n=1 Tax=Arvicanthis niloticus TaxID=61156 RepID=UPI00402B53FC